jgi:hypothetical protein
MDGQVKRSERGAPLFEVYSPARAAAAVSAHATLSILWT